MPTHSLCVCAARIALAAGLTISLTSAALAGDEGFELAPGTLHLRTGVVSTQRLPNLATRPEAARGAVRPGYRTVLQLHGPLNDHQRALLTDAGVKLGDYLPQHAYLADVSAADLRRVSDLGFVRWVGEWRSEWKLEPELGTRAFESVERRAIDQAGDVLVQAYLLDGVSIRDARAALEGLGGVRIEDSVQIAEMETLMLRVPRGKVAALADVDAVRFVEELPELTERSNSNTRWIVQSNVTNLTPLYAAGIRGEGQVVGIIDNGFQPSHCSFNDPAVPITAANTPGTFPSHRKVVAYNVALTSAQHGTHVAGTSVGNQVGDVNDNTRGIAFNSKMCFRTYSSPISTFPIDLHLTTHHNQGARVHTNSWGDDGTTAYNAICRAIDLFSYNFEDNLVCFAATNLSALKNPENAKNVLSVGKSGGSGSQAGSCSTLTGPTADGRRKPEVFAPGCSTTSSNSLSLPCGTTSLTGTSMASPAVAGAATLVRQYFTDGFYPTGTKVAANSLTPSGALLRAMLVNSSVDMTSYPSPAQFPPNNLEGFGRILLDNSVYLAGDARRLLVKDIRNTAADALATGNTSTTQFRVNGSAEVLRVTLAFTDAPATVPTSFAPVNNINLRVISPDGTVYLGNVFNAATGQSQTGGSADAINSVEHVLLAAPATGVWKVEVVGATVNVGKQGFGLVITGDVAAVNLCPADLNADSQVDDADFAIFAAAYEILACASGSMPAGCPADFNADGSVDDADFVVFATAYEALVCP
ncbi:MAG: S8 family serine peptidase [Phycisphaerales bacterium]|nr:S8 family serine peptidase [Phycisphaerales bacterium]